MESIASALETAVDYAWGPPLLVVMLGGGALLTLYSRFLPFVAARHALKVLSGKYDRKDDPGQITHFQALTTALSATIGMGNIGGVAIAITQGGPGAVFWMWLAATFGMAIKFFDCTLSVMYRGHDSQGTLQGGPMYYIEVGLGRKWRALAVFFSLCGMVGCLAMFQTNQMAEILSAALQPGAWDTGVSWIGALDPVRWIGGGLAVALVAMVVLGGITRIARVASRLVPAMCVLYLGSALLIVLLHIEQLPDVLARIFGDAFTGTAAVGGAEGIAFATVIQTGIKRAAFSNEAGIGTAPMAHGAAKTTEPVREGLVAMLGPFIDTVVVCSLTAFVILLAGEWQPGEDVEGVALTLSAFGGALGWFGQFTLLLVVTMFALTTMFGYSYYGKKCFSYLFGAERGRVYDVIYLIALFCGAVWSLDVVINLLDTAFACMAFPNMLATLILAPRVMRATREYLKKYTGKASASSSA